VRLEDIVELEERLGRDERAAADTFAERLRRLREAHAVPLLPAPEAGAPVPPRPWCDTDDEDGDR
jgi:hypothetical protein